MLGVVPATHVVPAPSVRPPDCRMLRCSEPRTTLGNEVGSAGSIFTECFIHGHKTVVTLTSGGTLMMYVFGEVPSSHP